MDSEEEKDDKNVKLDEKLENFDGETNTESIGSPPISPNSNKNEIGDVNIEILSPKSVGSSSKFDIDKGVGKSLDFDASKTESNEETNESPLLPPKVSNDDVGEIRNSELFSNDDVGEIRNSELSSNSIESSLNANLEVNSTPIKGHGLKKWRRIRRNLTKDTSGGADSLIILKRQHSVNEPSKRHENCKSKSIVEKELETPANINREVSGFDPKLVELVSSSGFSIGADSDNDDDQSSKSSSIASVNKPRHEIGFGRQRARIKNVGVPQRIQRGSGCVVDASKKIRGDRLRLEKENSLSSIESSSNLGFLRRESGVSNGKKSEKGLADDLENLDSTVLNDGKIKENIRPPSEIDPFADSIVMLQAAQEALETEIQKLGDIGKVTTVDDFDDQSEETEINSLPKLGGQLVELNQKIEHLNYRLEEASGIIKAKESKVIELEHLIKETSNAGVEFEELIKKKIEAEIETLIIGKITQNWKILAEDQIALLEEQDKIKFRDAEVKATKLKEQAEELETYCKELLGTKKVLKLKNKIFKFSFCSLFQLLLLCFALGLFLIQLMPPSDEFVPT